MGNGTRRNVNDLLAAPLHRQAPSVGDLTDHHSLDVPLAADRHERVHVRRSDHGTHALLRFTHQDLFRRQRRVTQRNSVEHHVHATLAVTCELARRARNPGATEVLNPLNQPRTEHLKRAFDEQLLHERVADLNARALRRAALVERLRGEHTHATDSVAAGARAIQNDLVANTLRAREVHVLVLHRAHTQCVDQRVACVGGVENDLSADVRQAQAVAVAADTRDHTRQNSLGVLGVGRAEPQRIHHRKRTSAHRDDVAHDAADAGGSTLVRLHVGRVVVTLDLERDGPAVTDVDDAGVFADAHQERVSLRRLLAELAKVHLARLVRAVLTPHHRVHRELGARGAAAEDLADRKVFVVLDPKFGIGLRVIWCGECVGNGVDHASTVPPTSAVTTEAISPRPSVLGPVNSSTACSGCGIRPTTFPDAFVMPAMSRREPFGFTST